MYQGFEIPWNTTPSWPSLFAGEEIEARPSRDPPRPCPNIESAVRKRTSYFHQRALEVEDFVKGHYDTHFVDKHIAKILEVSRDEKTSP